jgi:hypothetical protein
MITREILKRVGFASCDASKGVSMQKRNRKRPELSLQARLATAATDARAKAAGLPLGRERQALGFSRERFFCETFERAVAEQAACSVPGGRSEFPGMASFPIVG